MPTVNVTDGTRLRYECAGESDRSAVAFVPEVGFGPWAWGWQAPALSGPYRTLVYAVRGTDGSDSSGPYAIDRFVADLEAVLSAAGLRRVHLVGAGLGGMVALRHARKHGRVRSLSLLGVPPSGDRIDERALSKLHPSDPDALEASLSVGFTDRFRSETDLAERILEWRRAEDATGEALAGHKAAAMAYEAKPLYELSIPALVCHGVEDSVAPVDAGERLAAALPRGRFEPIAGKRCCYIEHAAAVTDEIEGFIGDVERETGAESG
jgi:pimeloyl-ACP methyl ester carboxylesterase